MANMDLLEYMHEWNMFNRFNVPWESYFSFVYFDLYFNILYLSFPFDLSFWMDYIVSSKDCFSIFQNAKFILQLSKILWTIRMPILNHIYTISIKNIGAEMYTSRCFINCQWWMSVAATDCGRITYELRSLTLEKECTQTHTLN